MSKVIKQMQMDALAGTFHDVRDLVVLSIKGLTAQADNQLRAALRKKKIRLQMVKNTYTRRVFDELGIRIPADSPYWTGTTVLAWGAGSVSELSRAIDTELKAPKTAAQYKDKVTIKGAIVDGMPTTFEDAIKMPTLAEAIGRVVMLALSAGSRLVGQILGPAGGVAGQIKTKSQEKTDANQPAGEAPAAGA
ncbi:MAG: 50S ribosomal protein L10 [Planctomycetes bacterium]|nr:50S ribosomal protein L10 [Planctomycetota bacterium]